MQRRARLEWGRRGARAAVERGDALVVVDTLSFSTAAITAIARGAAVRPCGHDEDPTAVAPGAEVAVRRKEVPEAGRFSLSPPTFLEAGPDDEIVLQSPNGATCSRYGGALDLLLVGAPVNAAAVAEAVAGHRGDVTVLACGERWPEDDTLRFALEDYLGAGAILARLPHRLSPDAATCAGAFLHMRSEFAALVTACPSGRELIELGYPQDVRHAARLDVYDRVPVLREGVLRQLEG
jgi:2-phosphosulfolactate phosphatase